MKFSAKDVSPVRSSRSARSFKPIELKSEHVGDYGNLSQIGIGFDQSYASEIADILIKAGYGFDSNDVLPGSSPGGIQTSASIPTLVQFLQAWLPGFVKYITAARKIDEFVGMSTIGSWEDAQVVQGMLEPQGNAVPYSDITNVPLTSWNVNFEWRSVVRFEMGFMAGLLEEARAARIRVSSSGEKRSQAGIALEIQRNRVGFYGYNDGANRTFGFLNDPNLPAYTSFPNGASGSPLWSSKTFNEITADIRTMFAKLQIQSMDRIDPEKTAVTMGLPMGVNQYLSVTQNVGGISVRQWLRETYAMARVVTAPELTDANGGLSAFYLYAESADDGSTDDGKTFIQAVPASFMALGVEKKVKGFLEDYANATAGVLVKRPYLIVRYTGG